MADKRMKWIDRPDRGVADVMAKDRAYHKVATVPLGQKDVVLRQKREFSAIVARHTADDGKTDWAAVATAFQAHVDRLIGG